MKSTLWFVVFVCLLSVFAAGQAQTNAKSSVDDVKREKIREVLKVLHVADNALANMKRQSESIKKLLPFPPKAQDDFMDMFLQELNVNDLMEAMIPIYEKHFTVEDLDALLAFYRSPVGQKFIDATPALTAEAYEAGAKIGRGIGERVGRQIGERLAAGEYGPWPPKASPDPTTPKQ